MQSQPSRPTDSASAPRPGVRRGAIALQPADRKMLQAVRDNLSHVRRSATTATNSSARHDMDASLSSPVTYSSHATGDGAVTGSQTGLVSCSRLSYNKKAMDEIRQSLQNYHVTTNYDVASTSHSVAASTSDNMVRQVILLGANEASSILLA